MDAETTAIMFGLGRGQLATLERHQMRGAVASLSRALDITTFNIGMCPGRYQWESTPSRRCPDSGWE